MNPCQILIMNIKKNDMMDSSDSNDTDSDDSNSNDD